MYTDDARHDYNKTAHYKEAYMYQFSIDYNDTKTDQINGLTSGFYGQRLNFKHFTPNG